MNPMRSSAYDTSHVLLSFICIDHAKPLLPFISRNTKPLHRDDFLRLMHIGCGRRPLARNVHEKLRLKNVMIDGIAQAGRFTFNCFWIYAAIDHHTKKVVAEKIESILK